MKKLNKDLILKYISDGWLMRQKHPTLPLWIYNYTQKTQYDRFWNSITLMCRGLILDEDFNIIAQPFKKFFNLSEHNQDNIPPMNIDQPFVITEKMDGSLLIVFKYKENTICASRGSFMSDQAIKGTEIISKKKDLFEKDFTYMFEVIYPKNQIIVDYKNLEDVILLGVIDTKTGIALPQTVIDTYSDTLNVVKVYHNLKDISKLKSLITNNQEGFVITFRDGSKVKIKGDEYVRLHRLLGDVSSKTIWSLLKNEQKFDELLEKIPDEYYDWIKKTKKDLEDQFKKVWFTTLYDFTNLQSNLNNRKDTAIEIKKHNKNKSGLLFLTLDADLIRLRNLIWDSIKPNYKKPFNDK